MLITSYLFFFFNDPATTEIYTLSLHDALPISTMWTWISEDARDADRVLREVLAPMLRRSDRKSTRLNSSHTVISYAVFCLKKKKNKKADIVIIKPAVLYLDIIAIARRRSDVPA